MDDDDYMKGSAFVYELFHVAHSLEQQKSAVPSVYIEKFFFFFFFFFFLLHFTFKCVIHLEIFRNFFLYIQFLININLVSNDNDKEGYRFPSSTQK
jgi:hypothetical protein